ncbi:MAG: alpha/beta fold hydrolase [Acidiferrobacterales bacterium]
MSKWHLRSEFSSSHGTVRYDLRGDGPALVLVHGTPWSSFNWRHVIPELAERWTVFFYDLLGYGQSEKRNGQDVSLGIQNLILAELLDHWGLKSPYIIGHDFGGTTVLRTHIIGKRDFEKIALLNSVALAPWGSPFFAHVKKYEEAFRGVPAYIHEAIVAAYVRGATYRRMNDETLTGIIRPWLGLEGQAAFYRQIAQAHQRFTDEIEPQYGAVTRPILILWGEEDEWIPLSTGRRLHDAISTSQFYPVPKAGHLVQEDAPAVITSHLIEFFESDESGGGKDVKA